MAEVRRLEDVRYQQMVDLVMAKGQELAAMCTDSHVAQPPGLDDALAAIDSNDRNPGAAAELLSKLLHMLAEVQVGCVGGCNQGHGACVPAWHVAWLCLTWQ